MPGADHQGERERKSEREPGGTERESREPRRRDGPERVQRGHVREGERRQERERSYERTGDVAGRPPGLGQIAGRRKLRLAEDKNADVAAEL